MGHTHTQQLIQVKRSSQKPKIVIHAHEKSEKDSPIHGSELKSYIGRSFLSFLVFTGRPRLPLPVRSMPNGRFTKKNTAPPTARPPSGPVHRTERLLHGHRSCDAAGGILADSTDGRGGRTDGTVARCRGRDLRYGIGFSTGFSVWGIICISFIGD